MRLEFLMEISLCCVDRIMVAAPERKIICVQFSGATRQCFEVCFLNLARVLSLKREDWS